MIPLSFLLGETSSSSFFLLTFLKFELASLNPGGGATFDSKPGGGLMLESNPGGGAISEVLDSAGTEYLFFDGEDDFLSIFSDLS